jgi:hypothetical protein
MNISEMLFTQVEKVSLQHFKTDNSISAFTGNFLLFFCTELYKSESWNSLWTMFQGQKESSFHTVHLFCQPALYSKLENKSNKDLGILNLFSSQQRNPWKCTIDGWERRWI